MAITDTSTNLSRLQSMINYLANQGWHSDSIRGTASNASAESHAWMETGDQYAASKYFDFCVYGGDIGGGIAGRDWYSVGQPVTSAAGAYGLWQFVTANAPSEVPAWNNFFPDGNTALNIERQLQWWLTRYSWIPGGNMSYTTTPNANSRISLDEYAKNVNNNSAEELSNIWYVNFERAGSGQYAGHNWNAASPLFLPWGPDFTQAKDPGSGNGHGGGDTGKPPDESKSPRNKATTLCIEYENTKEQVKPNENGDGGNAGPSGGDNTPGGTNIPNGTIPCVDAILGQRVGWGGANGQCYGFAEWWIKQCGGPGDSMTSGTASGNPNIGAPRPAGQDSPGIPASCIPWDYPWGSPGMFQNFTAGAGVPPGGFKTGDIVCFTNNYSPSQGHVVVVKSSSGNDFTWYDQNWGVQWVTVNKLTYQQAMTSGIMTSETGWVRPKTFPQCAGAVPATANMMPLSSQKILRRAIIKADKKHLNAIDISDNQEGINLGSLNPSPDIVIIKASQGGSYTNRFFNAWARQAQLLGKAIGAYHYLDGSATAKEEAAHFVQVVKTFQGHAIWFADWEQGQNSQWGNVAYLEEFMDEVTRLIGVTGGLYIQQSSLNIGLQSIKDKGHELWFAQYANMDPTGWQDDPWNSGAPFGPWGSEYLMQQYTSNLRLNGYDGPLDGSIVYTDLKGWDEGAINGSTSKPGPTVDNKTPPSTNKVKNDPCMGLGIEFLVSAITPSKPNVKTMRK